MQFDLIHHWLYPCVGPKIKQHGHSAVADSDILNKSKIHHALELSPHLMHRCVKDDRWLSWGKFGKHPMHEIEVNIF